MCGYVRYDLWIWVFRTLKKGLRSDIGHSLNLCSDGYCMVLRGMGEVRIEGKGLSRSDCNLAINLSSFLRIYMFTSQQICERGTKKRDHEGNPPSSRFLPLALLAPTLLSLTATLLRPTTTTTTISPQLPLQPPRNLSTNTRMLILPHPTIPIPLSPLFQIPIDDTSTHPSPARAGTDEVPGAGLQLLWRGLLAFVVLFCSVRWC